MWSGCPWIPFRDKWEPRPFISALRPESAGFSIAFFDTAEGAKEHILHWRRRFSDIWSEMRTSAGTAHVTGLYDYAEYELYISAPDGRRSTLRLVRTGAPLGDVVNYLHPDDTAFGFSGRYFGSPSIVRLPSGILLAAYDLFCSGFPMCLMQIFASTDNGKTWEYRCDLLPAQWGKLFVHHGRLYMLAVSREYGDLLIGESKDEGRTWENPTVIGRGLGNGRSGFHRAPCPYALCGGRIWFAVENGSWSESEDGFDDMLVSAPEEAVLTDAESWTFTRPAKYKPSWRGEKSGTLIEGNPFIGADGELYVLYRCAANDAVLMRADAAEPSRMLEFAGRVMFPPALSKFEIVRLEDGTLVAVGNEPYEDGRWRRNVLSMYRSENGKEWDKACRLIDASAFDREYTGFQYPGLLLENDALTVISRTAWNGAHTYHDSNMVTIHRFELNGPQRGADKAD